MKLRKPAPRQFAICVNNAEYPAALELHKVYRVLPDRDAEQEGDLRIIDESGEDYLFPGDYFILLNLPREPARTLSGSYSRASRAS